MTTDFAAALTTFSDSFAAGDVDRFLELFADDARVLLHEQPALLGLPAISESFVELFAGVDTSAFAIELDVVDVSGDRAYVLASFTETLVIRDGPTVDVDGRIVIYWRRDPDGWRVIRVLTSRAAPDRIR
jgi:uncharacterized protein (TIGR02246 family)